MISAMRTRKIAQLEAVRGSRVILLVNRQETMRFLGFPLVRYIDVNDSEAVLRAIQLTDDDVPRAARKASAGGAGDGAGREAVERRLDARLSHRGDRSQGAGATGQHRHPGYGAGAHGALPAACERSQRRISAGSAPTPGQPAGLS